MRKPSTIKIGKIIQRIRRSHGLTQEELAEKIDVSTRYVSDIEQDNSKPSYEVLVNFCNLFQIGLDQIFDEYLKIENKDRVNFSLKGYDKLCDKDKETIEHLIMYFNKK